jgi:membrane-associated phospholipid phosphatase
MPRRASGLRVAVIAAGIAGAISFAIVVALAVYVRHGTGFTSYDWRVLRRFRTHRSPHVVDLSNALADLGSIESLVLIAAIVGLWLRSLGLRALLCVTPLVSLLASGLMVEVIKVAVARVGPHARFEFARQSTGSFPSGHAADTTALAFGLAIVLVAVVVRPATARVAVFVAAAGISVAVGVSRLVLGVHWPTDVVAGWAVGLGAAVAVGMLAVLATYDRPFTSPTNAVAPFARHGERNG